jgi:hypothetical protein
LLGVAASGYSNFRRVWESLGWVLQVLQVWSAWIYIIMGIGMLQNAHAFNPAGSGWVHYKLIRWSEPRLAGDTEQPFTRIQQAIEQADMAKVCGDSFGYFDITSL